MQVADTIRDFILQELAADQQELNISQSDDLVAMGVLDSMAILQLADYLEKEFGVKVSDNDMVPENFGSLERIDQFVQKKKSA